jgi:phosphoribosyl-AMP cyclohydrolase
MAANDWLENLSWNENGLMPAIAQDATTGQVLMQAWINRQALELSLAEGRAIYWSRSRNKLWRKGEESGHIQKLKSIRLDCDGDCLLLEVEQLGGIACHTGRATCFHLELMDGEWTSV